VNLEAMPQQFGLQKVAAAQLLKTGREHPESKSTILVAGILMAQNFGFCQKCPRPALNLVFST
jgi:hypothetical protein